MCASPHVFTLQTYFCVRCDNFFFEILSIRCIPVYEIIIHTCMTPDPSLSPPSPSLPYPQSELCLGTFMKSWGFAVHCLFQQISGWVNRQSQTLATIDSSPPNFSVTAETVSKMRPDPTNKVKWFISSQWTRECLRPSFMQGVQSEIITYLKGIKHTKTFIWYAKTIQTLVFYCIYIHR